MFAITGKLTHEPYSNTTPRDNAHLLQQRLLSIFAPAKKEGGTGTKMDIQLSKFKSLKLSEWESKA